MLHVRALRGFVPTDLVIDTSGYIPLPGDEMDHFTFFWFTDYHTPIVDSDRLRIFRCWCDNNVVIVGRTMVYLAKWRGAITDFQRGCDEEMERRKANFKLNELWRVDFTHSEQKNTT